jgi:hypothetical protein
MNELKKAASLTKSTTKIMDEYVHFHNGAELSSFFKNPAVDTTTKLAVDMGMTYTYSKASDETDKYYKQNTHLKKKFGLRSKHSNSTIQKAIKKLARVSIIENVYFVTSTGEKVKWEEKPGLTKRHIKPDMNKIIEILKVIPSDDAFKTYKARGNQRRMVYQRPFSIIEELTQDMQKKLTREKISEMLQRKKRVNLYVDNQKKRYHDFTGIIEHTFTKTREMLMLVDNMISKRMIPALFVIEDN